MRNKKLNKSVNNLVILFYIAIVFATILAGYIFLGILGAYGALCAGTALGMFSINRKK